MIVLLSGHSPPTQIKMLRDACRSFNRQGRAISLGTPEMGFATDIYARAIRIFSPRVFHLIREALDVHSIGELVRYLRWTASNS